MKKKTKKILGLIVLIILSVILCIKYLSSIHFAYKVNWNISIPNPKNVDIIYENTGFQFGRYLEVMHYGKKNIKKLTNKGFFKKIEGENKEYLINKYNEYLATLDEELKQLFNNTINPDSSFNEKNYYAIFEENYGKPNYRLLILIIDVNNNIYSIQFYR